MDLTKNRNPTEKLRSIFPGTILRSKWISPCPTRKNLPSLCPAAAIRVKLPKRVNLAANKTLDPRQRYDNIVLPGLALRTVTPIPRLLFRFLSPTFGTQRSYDEFVFASFQQSLILN